MYSPGPATTIFDEPGGNSSAAATSTSGTLRELELVEPCEARGQRRALRLVQGDLQRRQAEQRTLQAHRCELDADLCKELILVERCDLGRSAALHHLHQHRRRRLRDRAAATGELHL